MVHAEQNCLHSPLGSSGPELSSSTSWGNLHVSPYLPSPPPEQERQGLCVIEAGHLELLTHESKSQSHIKKIGTLKVDPTPFQSLMQRNQNHRVEQKQANSTHGL